MDYKRIALAAVVAWLVDLLYGIVVYMVMLGDEFGKYPAVFRAEGDLNAHVPLMLAGSLVGLFALAYIYAKGYDGGNGLAEGTRFGVLLGVFAVFYITVGMYATTNIGGRLAFLTSISSFVEMMVIGAVIGGVYRSARRTQTARVATL